MTWIFAVISIIICAVVCAAAVLVGKKMAGGAGGDWVNTVKEEAASLERSIKKLSAPSERMASQAQVDSVASKRQEFVETLEKQKALLAEIESKLTSVQKSVEEKEAIQQEMKSIKEEDEARLAELNGQYEQVSAASVALEQELSQSLKSLDTMMAEVPMNADQKAVFQELSDTMTGASSRLRDLITDYQAAHERLENLQQQHNDLEDEYTKLVEQQLGA